VRRWHAGGQYVQPDPGALGHQDHGEPPEDLHGADEFEDPASGDALSIGGLSHRPTADDLDHHGLRGSPNVPEERIAKIGGSMESWKEKALAAADAEVALEHNAERLQKEAERAKQVEAFQFALSGLLEEDIEANALEITVDGVTFHW
jgi:hypothetical protein